MSKRLALLIGVRDYVDPHFQSLPVVQDDLSSMQTCLGESGYEVAPFGLDVGEQAGSTVFQKIQMFCMTAPEKSTLVIYFSGHGLHYNGHDYLVPGDFHASNAAELERLLIPVDISNAVENSPASTVAFFVDACRNGVDIKQLDSKAMTLSGWGKEKIGRVKAHKFAVILGCSPGEFCQFIGGEEPFSLFTKALVKSLTASHPARTLREVIDAAQVYLDQLSKEHRKQPQHICVSSERRQSDESLSDFIICSGISDDVAERINNKWIHSVHKSILWNGIKDLPSGTPERLKARIDSIIVTCRKLFDSGRSSFPEDPWVDEDFPIRVLDRLGFLIHLSNPRIYLSAVEQVLLMIAPFIREGVLGNGLRLAGLAAPLDLPPGSPIVPYRGKLDQAYETYPQLIRKATRLLQLGRPTDSYAVIAWIVHRTLLQDPELWLQEPQGLLSAELWQCISPAAGVSEDSAEEPVIRALEPSLLLELAKCVCGDLERLEREDKAQVLQFETQVAPATPYEETIRPRALGYLLSLAGWLAIDPRLLSDVVVDHVGLANPLTPGALLKQVQLCSWHAVGNARSLQVKCDHPAADLAFRDYTAKAGDVLARCHRAAVGRGDALGMLNGLPVRLTDEGIVPAQIDGKPAYQLPHLRFELAQDEIRELLMGEQLYGSPVFAIRELYQNALDALRFREARMKYLELVNPEILHNKSWKGEITFRQGETEDGRPYLECEDNGIGMGQRELSECFARAGKRFATLPDFIEERSQWLRCDPPIHIFLNSQFGVGVFSYFMLADELLVETCRLDRDGHPGPRLEVHVSSSGSLFRVRVLGEGEEAGTRVRLFLNKTSYTPLRRYIDVDPEPISCKDMLVKLIGIAEFPLYIEEGGKRYLFSPGKLYTGVVSTILEDKTYPSGHPDVWWHNGTGVPLADGIAVRDVDDWLSFDRGWDLPLIVNFHGVHYPRLSVNRTKLVEYDKDWLNRVLEEHYYSATQMPFLSWEWLLDLHHKLPAIASKIVASLWDVNSVITILKKREKTITEPIRKLGWWAGDRDLLKLAGKRLKDEETTELQNLEPKWWIPHRLKYLESLGVEIRDAWEYLHPPKGTNNVVPEERDRIILVGELFESETESALESAEVKVAVDLFQLALLSARERVPIMDLICRLERYTSLGVTLPNGDIQKKLQNDPLTPEDLLILSRAFDAKPTYVRSIWAPRLIRTSAALKRSLGSIHERLQSLAYLGIEVVDLDYAKLADTIASPSEADVVRTVELNLPWSHIGDLVRSAKLAKQSPADTFRAYAKFVPLLKAPPNWPMRALESLEISENDLILLSAELDGKTPWASEITHAHIEAAATKLNMPKNTIVQLLSRYEPFGIMLPRRSRSGRKKTKPKRRSTEKRKKRET